MTASDDAITRIEILMHAQGHAFQAADNARLAQRELADGPAGLAALALAVAQIADAVSGIIDASAQSISDAHGLTYGEGRNTVGDPGVTD